MRQRRTHVLVVADNDVHAATIESALRDHADVEVAARGPRTLAQLLDRHDAAVVVVATTAPRVDSVLENMTDLRVPPVILLVEDTQGVWTPAARRAGVHAVLPLDASGEQIVAALAAVTTGLVTLHPDVFNPAARSSEDGADEPRALTTREREILDMLAEGLSNRAIARRLGISAYTVKFHVASILAKLHAASRTEAVTLGLRNGLISL